MHKFRISISESGRKGFQGNTLGVLSMGLGSEVLSYHTFRIEWPIKNATADHQTRPFG
jgi:hypothetical protein